MLSMLATETVLVIISPADKFSLMVAEKITTMVAFASRETGVALTVLFVKLSTALG